MHVKMRILFLFGLVFALPACRHSKIVRCDYHSVTMMAHRTVVVTKDSVSLTVERRLDSSSFTAKRMKRAAWRKLVKSAAAVQLDSIRNLKAPSNDRATDAAPFGRIWLYTKDSTYASSTFDGRRPHSMLAPVMQSILNLQKEVQEVEGEK